MLPVSPVSRRTFVASLALWPFCSQARPAPQAPALLLARQAPAAMDPDGWLVSEKFDGVRAFWDGRQLRFRSGAPIAAPAWFTRRLPALPLDGELWLGRGRFQALSGLARSTTADTAAWQALRYMLFELPGGEGDFAARAARLRELAHGVGWPQLIAVEQQRLPSAQALQQRLAAIVAAGGEGLMLHRADSPYHTGRSPALLKLKPLQDAEAQVIGQVAGRGKHARRLGALRVRSESGIEFLLGTGFSDAEREAPPPLGSWVTFSYRGLTAGGVPRFASFLRVSEV